MYAIIYSFFIFVLPLTSAFSRDTCLRNVKDQLEDRTLSPSSPYFFRDFPGAAPYNGPSNVTLTLAGCNALCGPQQTFYTDIGPRLITWVIPIFLLIANADLSPLDKRNFLTVIHLLGDPIDSLWSLLHKLDTWDSCYNRATQCTNLCPSCQRTVASVLALYEEVHGPRIVSDHDFQALLQKPSRTTDFNEWRRVAVRLADGRTDELTRTVFAFVVYVFQLIAAFVPAVGGVSSSPPGGRIAISVMLSWLIPVILLTNAVGSLSSRRTAYNILSEFAANTRDQHILGAFDQHSVFRERNLSAHRERDTEYFDALAWSGSIYTYRPWKLRHITSTRHHHRRTLLLAMFAAAPVLVGLAGGILILWFQLPVGLNCRHPWLITVGLFWVLSALFTWKTYTPRIATGIFHWRLTLIKDACIAIPSLVAMLLSVVGMYNSCYCWSGPFQYRNQGRVPLESTVYWINVASIYPIIVGATLGLEVLLVVLVAIRWRRGLALLRWDEKSLAEEWDRVWTGAPCPSSRHHCQNASTVADSSERQDVKSGADAICTSLEA